MKNTDNSCEKLNEDCNRWLSCYFNDFSKQLLKRSYYFPTSCSQGLSQRLASHIGKIKLLIKTIPEPKSLKTPNSKFKYTWRYIIIWFSPLGPLSVR